MLKLVGVVIAEIIGYASAQKVGLKSTLGFGCWNSAFNYDFGCQVELPYDCRCANDNFLATAFACVYLYGKEPWEIDAGYDFIQSQCHYWGNRTMTPQEMDDILGRKMTKIIDEGWLNGTGIVDSPVFTPEDLYKSQHKGAKETLYHYRLGTAFGLTMVIYWCVVNLCAMIGNLWKLTSHDAFDKVFGNKFANWWRHTFTLPPAVGKRHHVPHRILGFFDVNAPTRGQSLVVFGFLAINVVSLTAFYDSNPQDKPLMFVTNGHKIMRYMANRTGIIAFSLIPMIVLFASRNNPLIPMTGWSYDTYQMYHRWCARMMAMHAIIHAVLLTWYSAQEHVLMFKWRHVHNWPAGNVACYLMIIMVVFAFQKVRVKVYEVFVAIHKLFFILFLAGLFVHCSDYGWLGWIIAAAAIYFLEYMGRTGKVIKSGWIQKAEFTIAANDMYRITTTQKREWNFSAGQYAYIRVLDKSLFWQEHPFSLFKGSENQLELMCKAKSGATKKIYEMLKANGGSKQFKIMIEGPYGREHNLRDYNSVFILAGGVGITAMYSYIVSVAPVLRDEQRLTLIWVLKDKEYVEAHKEEVEHLATLSRIANIQIYLTRGSPPQEEEECKSGATSVNSDKTLANVLMYGRPKINYEISDFIEHATGSIAVCACGPPSFVDGTRSTIVENIRRSKSLIHYFEEAFSW